MWRSIGLSGAWIANTASTTTCQQNISMLMRMLLLWLHNVHQPYPTLLSVLSGLCSRRAWWPLAPNFCPQATRKSHIFHTNHMLGTLDFTVSEHWVPFNFPWSTALTMIERGLSYSSVSRLFIFMPCVMFCKLMCTKLIISILKSLVIPAIWLALRINHTIFCSKSHLF